MLRLLIRLYALYLSLLAFSAVVGVHIHRQVASGAPQVILPWSPINLALDHRQLPEPEKTLLEFALEKSIQPDVPHAAVIPVSVVFTLQVPSIYNVARFTGHNTLFTIKEIAAFAHPLRRRPPPEYLI